MEVLAKDGSEIYVVSRRPFEGFQGVVDDLTSADLDLSGARCSEVYHLAGLAHFVPRSASETKRFFEVNVEGTRNLLQALERAGVLPECVVFVSSVAVYGVEAGELLNEETPRGAVDPYGASKRVAEDLLWDWGVRRGVRIAIARLPLMVGRDAPGNFGTMVRALRAGRYFGVGSGRARRSMVLVNDAACGLRELALADGVFHLTDGRHPSFVELEACLARALERETPWRVPFWAARLGAWVGDGAEWMIQRSLPLNSRTLSKMTATLTFCDQKARDRIGWKPGSVIEHISEMFA